MTTSTGRRVALVTGVGRRAGIGAAVALRLAESGWNIAFTYWAPYDAKMPWGRDAEAPQHLGSDLDRHGADAVSLELDLSELAAPPAAFDAAERALGPVEALVMCHCESVASDLLNTTVESFDRHFAVNARASWLLIREFATRFRGDYGAGRIVSLTSDSTSGNLPYGASKAALDRITLAATRELAHLGVTANLINPGATDTGWMSQEQKAEFAASVPLGRVGQPKDCANLVAFLCTHEGGWINGQLLHSNGGSTPVT